MCDHPLSSTLVFFRLVQRFWEQFKIKHKYLWIVALCNICGFLAVLGDLQVVTAKFLRGKRVLLGISRMLLANVLIA